MGVDIPLASENWPLTQQGRVQVTFSPAQADLFCRVYATDLDNIVTLQKGTGTGLTTGYRYRNDRDRSLATRGRVSNGADICARWGY